MLGGRARGATNQLPLDATPARHDVQENAHVSCLKLGDISPNPENAMCFTTRRL